MNDIERQRVHTREFNQVRYKMAFHVISNLAPALVPIVVKLIDNFLSSDGSVTPPEMKERRTRNICRCEIRGPPSRHDINECNTCGRPYPVSNISKPYLNAPTIKTRSYSTSDSYGNNNISGIRSTRRGRSLSDSCHRGSTNGDTMKQLGRRLEAEANKSHGNKYYPPSSRGAIKKSIVNYEYRKTSTSSK